MNLERTTDLLPAFQAPADSAMITLPRIFTYSLLVGSIFAAQAYQTLAAEERVRPNVLFFLVDDMGVADTSVRFLRDAEGEPVDMPLNERYRTPSIERLAAQGRLFVNARAYAVCSPTRTSILTGQTAERLRITTWTHPKQVVGTGAADGPLRSPTWRMEGLDPAIATLPGILREAGYRTIHSGKAHFGPDATPAGDPLNIGFDVNIAGYGGGGPGSYWGEKNFSAAWRGGGHDWDVPGLEKYHGTDIFLTEAITLEMCSAIDEAVAAGQPFFAHLSHYAVHAPFETDARFAENYPELESMPLAFATLVEGVDKSLGDLLDHLEAVGAAADTLVVFYSDNGSDGPPNLPLRGKKGTRFEGGLRVPMIVAWAKTDPENPNQQRLPIPESSWTEVFATPADFLPTLTAVVGVDLPEGLTVDGYNLVPALTEGTHPRKPEFLAHFPHARHNNTFYTSFIKGDWKLIYQYEPGDWQLYHLAEDIGEQHDLVRAEPERALEMARCMIQRLEDRGALFPLDAQTGEEVRPNLAALEEAVAAGEG